MTPAQWFSSVHRYERKLPWPAGARVILVLSAIPWAILLWFVLVATP